MQVCFVANLSQRECVGRGIRCTQQLCDKVKECARVFTVLSLSAISHAPSAWASFARPRRSLLLKQLRHVLFNPLENGDATGQHDLGAQILADLFVTCSVESESPLNSWSGRNCLLSWNKAPKIRRIASCCPLRRKVVPFAAPCGRQRSSFPSHHPPPPPQQCQHLPRTLCFPQTISSTNRRVKNSITVHENPRVWKQTTRWRSVWLRVASLGHPRRDLAALASAAAAV